MEALIAGAFGLLIGSFLNVCIYRWPRDLSVVAPRSFCPGCGRGVAWYDNVPVLSWLALGGRCRNCRASVSWRYPLVELATGLAFFAAFAHHGVTPRAATLSFFSACLVTLFFTDLEARILPDEVTIGGAVVGWVAAAAWPRPGGLVMLFLPPDRLPAGESLIAALAGGLLPAGFFWLIGNLYFRIRGRDGLGLGDVKMMLLVGAFLGLEGTMMTIILGSVAGSLVGGVLYLRKGGEAATYELPFGSFLAAAALVVAHWLSRLPIY